MSAVLTDVLAPTADDVSIDRTDLAMLLDGLDLDLPTAGLRATWSLRVAAGRAQFQAGPRPGRAVAVTITEPVRVLLSLVEFGPVPPAALTRALGSRLPGGPAQASTLIADAVQAGLLVVAVDLPAGLDALAAEQSTGRAHELTTLLRDLLATSHHGRNASGAPEPGVDPAPADRPTEDPAGDLDELERVRRALDRHSRYPVRLRLHRSAVLARRQIDLDPRTTDDLFRATDLASIFDPTHDRRALLDAAFVDRFGAGAEVPLVDAAADLFASVVRRSHQLGPDTWDDFGPADGTLARLFALRTRIVGHLTSASSLDITGPTLAALFAADGGRPSRVVDGPSAYRLHVRIDAAPLLLGIRPTPVTTGRERSAAQWLGVTLAHDATSDRLSLRDADGAVLSGMRVPHVRPGPPPAPIVIVRWLTETGLPALDSGVLGRDLTVGGMRWALAPGSAAGERAARGWYLDVARNARGAFSDRSAP